MLSQKTLSLPATFIYKISFFHKKHKVITMADDYEIIPHKLLSDLKYDVEALQKKLTQPDSKAEELLLELEQVKTATHDLTTVFTKALEEVKEEGDLPKKLDIITEKLEAVISQNETIAKGMIAISDKVEDFISHAGGPAPTPQPRGPPVQHNMGLPPSMGKVAPFPGNMPPPPPPGGKKRGGIF
jgi:hypothetical protein